MLKESNLLHLNLNIHQLTAATSACSFLTISILVLHVQGELWPSQEQHNLWSCGFRPFSTTLTYCLTCWPQVCLLCHHSNKAHTVVFQYFLACLMESFSFSYQENMCFTMRKMTSSHHNSIKVVWKDGTTEIREKKPPPGYGWTRIDGVH